MAFLDVPLFGGVFLKRALPEVKEINPPTRSEYGYDGQVYAQIALSPSLRHPGLSQACDNFRYRARRIGLPVLAYIFGLGRPAWILQAYSVLNFFFWLAMMGAMARFVGFVGIRERLLVLSVLWTSGTLFSLQRALTDLPTMTLSFWGMILADTHVVAAGSLLAISALFKETGILSFPALVCSERKNPSLRLVWMITLLVSPALFWWLYVYMNTSPVAEPSVLFKFPFLGWWEKLSGRLQTPSEFWVPITLGFQVVYMVIRARFSSTWWRWGIGWVGLFTVMSGPLVEAQEGYTRVLLPLTVAFNVLVYRHEKRWAYVLWFLLGNFGTFSCAWSGASQWPVSMCVAGLLLLELIVLVKNRAEGKQKVSGVN